MWRSPSHGIRKSDLPPVATPTRPYLLEQIDDAAVVQLYADGFDKLSLEEKTLVWHLYQAALAGRDIYYDQRHRHNLGMRDLLEADRAASRAALPAATLAELTRYTKLFWLNTGPYNNLTARKFVLRSRSPAPDRGGGDRRGATAPGFRSRRPARSIAELRRALRADVLRSRLRADGHVQDAGRRVRTSSPRARTISTTASRWPTSRASRSSNQLNSRLVKRDGRLVEEVYRVGGLYDREHPQDRRVTCATRCRSRRSRSRRR